MRRILATAAVLLAVGAFLFLTLGSSSGSGDPTYKIELDNAFGLVSGSDFKVAGVIAGSIQSITLDQKTLHAVVTLQVSQKGFGQFHSDAFCQSRPQSLIGEYFIDCNPGTTGKVLPPGSTIPVTQTQSTIPADLVQDIMQLPYRERFSIIINELGAAVASRSEDLAAALRRADPALAETDNLLALLGNDAQTIRDLNANANTVITALAKNSTQVQRFVVEANNAASASATQAPNIEATWNKLPAFLQELRPALAKLGAAADAQDPVLQNLNASSSNLRRFFVDLAPFSRESLPAVQSLGRASVTGKSAAQAATPTVSILNQFAKPTPELAQNLSIVLQDLDNRNRAVERDPRSPDGGRGYTGLEALLQYVFNITNAINYFGPYGHMLGVDAFANTVCSPYATPATIAQNLAMYNAGQSSINPRSCYSWLGPNQPGVNEPDPSWNAKGATAANPSACVPDPGGYPVEGYGTSYYGPKTTACKLTATSSASPSKAGGKHAASARRGAASSAPSGAGGSKASGGSGSSLQQTIAKIVSGVTGAGSALGAVTGAVGNTTGAGATTTSPSAPSAGQTEQLLNYLLAP